MNKFLLIAVTAFVLTSGTAFAAGAIAVDDEAGMKPSDAGYGIGSGSTRETAAVSAMAECKSAGNTACVVAVKYDVCGAYAASMNYSGVGWGNTLDDAESAALEACGKSCKIVVSDCDQ